jgi:hypothetical protein
MKLTGWYSGDQKPVRKGIYERDHGYCSSFSWFDGGNWRASFYFIEKAIENNGWVSSYQDLPWRGIQGEEE